MGGVCFCVAPAGVFCVVKCVGGVCFCSILCVRCVFPSPLLPPYVGGVCFCSKLCLVFCVGGVCFCSKLCLVFCVGGVCFCSKLCVVFCVGGVCFCVALALPSQTSSQKRPIDVAKEAYVVFFAQ